MNSGEVVSQAGAGRASATTVRRLTAPVSAAIAAIAIEGSQTHEVLRRALVTQAGRPFPLDRTGAKFALWRFDDRQFADEHVVVLVRDQQCVEVHCHGGVAITERIIGQLEKAGCEVRRELMQDVRQHSDELVAYPDEAAIRAAAERALIKAPTLKVSLVLLDQYQGALSAAFEQLASLLESRDFDAAGKLRDVLLARGRFGVKLLDAWRLTLAGPPNVGKSSLMNALCGSNRVLVHHEAGTTRDAVETNLVVGGWPVLLTDTAGIRPTAEPIERQGVTTAHNRWQKADIGLLIVDANVGWTAEHQRLLDGPEAILAVINKVDTVIHSDRINQLCESIDQAAGSKVIKIVQASATSSNGVQSLISQLETHLNSLCPERGSAVPFSTQQMQWLRIAGSSVSRIQDVLCDPTTAESN